MAKRKKPEAEQKKPDLIAELMLQRQERVNRAHKAITEICQKERVQLVVPGFDISADGKVQGRVNLIAVDQP